MEKNSEQELGFKSYFTDEKSTFSFRKWFVADGCLVKKGDDIYEYSDSILANALLAGLGAPLNKSLSHKAEHNGYIDIYFLKNGLHVPCNELMYVIRQNDNLRLARKSKEKTLQSLNSNTANTKSCFVYLMLDTANGNYKIGESNKPEYREKTLQNEKPTIELVASKKYQIRKIAENFEKALHKTYDDKRIRGEWFELNDIDVTLIKSALE